jgi:ADP-heptose:LPS heptosyltransferase
VGDALLVFPALAALRRSYPHHRLVLVGNPGVNPLAVSSGLADETVAIDDARVARLFMASGTAPPFGALDVAVAYCADPTGDVAANLAAWGAKRVVVAAGRPPDGSGLHAARHVWMQVAPMCRSAALELPTLRLSDSATARADALALPTTTFACIHLGSGSSSKNWPIESILALADLFEQRRGLRVVATAGPADAERLDHFHRARPATYTVSDVPLNVIAAVYRRASLYVGMDTGPTHLAAMLGVPTVAMFGPTDPAAWGPLGPRVAVVRQEPIETLAVERVWEAALTILG